MKTYLNREEKQNYFVLNGYTNYMNRLINDISKIKTSSKELIKNLKMAKTYTSKSINELIKNLDKDQMINLIKEVNKVQVVSKYTKEAVEEFEKMKLMDNITPIETDDLLDLFSHCVKICQLCRVSLETSERCDAKRIMLKYGCEPINYNTSDIQCPYQYAELESKNNEI